MKTPCIVCGESEPVAIDFHHINPNLLQDNIEAKTENGYLKRQLNVFAYVLIVIEKYMLG